MSLAPSNSIPGYISKNLKKHKFKQTMRIGDQDGGGVRCPIHLLP